ncbi:hypothetical protein HGRIS_004562 [Hohenbuehelia grisea]|uniref:Uncharacterized protein n=1 Tax=Hohenbuehelia grisea TaxID=104357 RepID=A0ABR3JC92_9AGAR
MICSRTVFRCFKALERFGDRITGAAGPYFVGLAVILMSLGTICFFDVILPSLPYFIITGPICALIALNLHAHYFYVCTVPPGFVDDPPPVVPDSILWAKKKVSNRPLTSSSGVNWTSQIKITKASTTKCRKCGQTKPEVSLSPGFIDGASNILLLLRGRTIAVSVIAVYSSMITTAHVWTTFTYTAM